MNDQSSQRHAFHGDKTLKEVDDQSPWWRRFIVALRRRWSRLLAFWAPMTVTMTVIIAGPRLLPPGWGLWAVYLVALLLLIAYFIYALVVHVKGGARGDAHSYIRYAVKRLTTDRPL